jgi:thiol:disulfide interchange protein DsbD
MFVLIGVIVGPVIITFATHPITNLVIGLFFLLFALVLFGVMELRPPQFLMSAAGKATTKGGLPGVFMMGATLVVTSFTCTAPVVGALLGGGAGSGRGLLEIALGMAVFGLTMAIPFVLLALLPGKIQAMPRSGEWMNTLTVCLGFVEVAAALKFLSNSDLIWGWELLSREVFLLLWTAIFAVGAAYLFGWIKLKKDDAGVSSPGRLVGGLMFLCFSVFCWFGFRGNKLGNIMAAIVPPYSSITTVASDGAPAGRAVAMDGHTIVADDYEGARKLAEREGKLLFVNFTGFL